VLYIRAVPFRSVPVRVRVDYFLDAALLIAFVLDYSFRFTGLSVHEWIGLGFGVALLVHLTLHWDWVVRITRRLFRTGQGRERLRWAINTGLVFVMTLCVASGVLISRVAMNAMGIPVHGGTFWRGLHTTTADICVVLVGVHVALDWKWIVTVSRRMIPAHSTRNEART
jgi:cytochrome b